MKKFYLQNVIILCLCNLSVVAQQPALLIHRILANPAGTDSPFELVELVATRTINFASETYTVVTADGGNTTVSGWVSGGTGSYGFQLSSGIVQKGDLLYVGGSGLSVDGTNCKILRTINTLTTAGDGFGAASTGVVGNGGTTADGVAIFNMPAASITVASIPIDALFYGTAIGSGSTKNFTLPANDLYAGGIYGTPGNTFLGPDPGSGDYIYVTSGVFNTFTNSFTTPRMFALNQSKPVCTDASNISFITTLPVKFEYFNLTSSATGVKLTWKLADNLDLKKFEILLSTDGINYQSIGSIDKINADQTYEYTDVSRQNGNLYYKIQAIELSGSTIYSAIQKIELAGSDNIILYTNPVRQFSNIHLSFSLKAARSINVFNTTGKLYTTVKSDLTELYIPTTNWSKGIYFVQVTDIRGYIRTIKIGVE